MKKIYVYILAGLLAGAMLLGICACTQQPTEPKDPSGEEKKDEETKKDDPSDDPSSTDEESKGVTLNDFDPRQEYNLPDYMKMNLADYITLGKYQNLTLNIAEADYVVTDAEIDSQIRSIVQKNDPAAKVTDRVTAWGDTVVVSYVGKIDGVAFSGGTSNNQTMELNESTANSYIPGFVEGIVGLMPGESKDVPVTFPENYGNKDYAGKDAVFTMTVSYIIGSPDATDEFISSYTEGKYTTVADYRAYLKESQETAAYDDLLLNTLWQKISDNAAVKQYDKAGVMYYYSYYYEMYSYYASAYSMTYETFLTYNGMTPSAIFSHCLNFAKMDMVRYAVCQDAGIQCTEDEYQSYLRDYAAKNFDELKAQIGNKWEGEFTLDDAVAYFDDTYHDGIFDECLTQKMYKELIKDATINVTSAQGEVK